MLYKMPKKIIGLVNAGYITIKGNFGSFQLE